MAINQKDITPFVSKITALLSDEDFASVLAHLVRIKTGAGLHKFEKLVLIEIFDHFLQTTEEYGLVYSGEDLETLAEIKKVLIVYQLESQGYNKEKLKHLIKRTVLAARPLGSLITKPFAFEINLGEGPLQYPGEYVLNAYQDVLNESSDEDARVLHSMQRFYFHDLPVKRIYARHTLIEFMEAVPL